MLPSVDKLATIVICEDAPITRELLCENLEADRFEALADGHRRGGVAVDGRGRDRGEGGPLGGTAPSKLPDVGSRSGRGVRAGAAAHLGLSG